MKYLVIIPAYNEENTIKELIHEIEKISECDVVVINDDSNDNTLNEAKNTNANVINLINNLGIGGAVQTGYKYALEKNYDYAFQIDGDGQHSPRYINEMIKKMNEENLDMLIGSRFVNRTNYKQTFFRTIGGKWISFIIKVLSKKKIYDPLSGYRLVNRKVISEFAKEYPYDYPEPETNLKLILKGYRVEEFSVEMKKREHGSSFVTPFTAIWYMIKVTLALIIQKINCRRRGK